MPTCSAIRWLLFSFHLRLTTAIYMHECSFVCFAGKTLHAGHIWFTLHNILQETYRTENWGKESNIESSIYIEQYRYFDELFQPYTRRHVSRPNLSRDSVNTSEACFTKELTMTTTFSINCEILHDYLLCLNLLASKYLSRRLKLFSYNSVE
jgi:hypothetical protein